MRRLSLNQATVKHLSLPEVIDLCARHDVSFLSAWRDRVAECGVERAGQLLRASGVGVSSLCRGGFFTQGTPRERLDDNLRALDEAAALGAEVLVLVCGGVVDRDVRGSRARIAEGVAELAPHARDRGVKLGVEPLHPMFGADRSAVVSLAQALDLVAPLPAHVGVVVDVYHVWWDPAVEENIARAGERILGFHVNDWITPLPDLLNGRGLMGDGVIELRRLREAVDTAGYHGPIEVEIFNEGLWQRDPDEVMRAVKDRYARHVVAEEVPPPVPA